MTEEEREVLAEIFDMMEVPEKVTITFNDPFSRDVTIHYPHMDQEWFFDLLKARGEFCECECHSGKLMHIKPCCNNRHIV